MRAAIPGLLDHLVDLMEGSVTGLDRYIDSDKFEFVDIPVEACFENAAGAPYPFEVPPESLSGTYPDDIQHTGSVNDIYDSVTLVVRVGYAANMHDQKVTSKDITEDVFRIRRTLGDQDAWISNSNFSRIAAGDWSVSSVILPGSDTGEDADLMFVLEQEFTIIYREDQT
jgi:hypothetical protein